MAMKASASRSAIGTSVTCCSPFQPGMRIDFENASRRFASTNEVDAAIIRADAG